MTVSQQIVQLYGHNALRQRLAESVRADKLPASLLLHGPRGTGKQRLALWIGQLLLCTTKSSELEPCNSCKACQSAMALQHPDLHWYFPRPKLKDTDPSPAEINEDYQEAIAERVTAGGLYAAPAGNEGIYVATVRTIVQQAAMSPAMGNRKIFIVGDAEQMVPQEGADMAANAFLKLLEEPLANTTIILTSSEPGALLPTIKSRVVSVRVAPLPERVVEEFVSNETVSAALDAADVPKNKAQRVKLANGAPGSLFNSTSSQLIDAARKLVDTSVASDHSDLYAAAFARSGAGARGEFSDVLEKMNIVLRERTSGALQLGKADAAMAAAKATDKVDYAMEKARGNVNPQLLTAKLLRDLRGLLNR